MTFRSLQPTPFLVVALCGSIFLFDVASAQPISEANRNSLDEVTITATRRETNLQTTPIAVSAVSSDFIEQISPHDIGDLAAFVPNFSASKITGFNAASFALRGVGQNNIIVYFESPVAVLVDDFVMPSVQTQLLDPFDLKNIEVLRGPQGTLFGKNTTGGVVSVHTRPPDMDQFKVQGQAGLGSYGSWYSKAAADLTLIPGALALRLVLSHQQDDGYYQDGACAGPIKPFVPGNSFACLKGCGSGKSIGGSDTPMVEPS